MEYNEYALCMKALGDETRVKIVSMLKGGTMCACKILEKFNITQPTLSYHMKLLVGCGLVNVEKTGTWNYYSLNKGYCLEMEKFFRNLNKKNKDTARARKC